MSNAEHAIQQSHVLSPNALPSGWRKVITPDGIPYYQNDITHQTQWNAPQPAAVPPTIVYSPDAAIVPANSDAAKDEQDTDQSHISEHDSISISSQDSQHRKGLNIHDVDIHAVSHQNDLMKDLHNEEDTATAAVNDKLTKLDADNYNPEDNTGATQQSSEIAVRKWWHPKHFILFIVFALNIFDFITDIQVGRAIMNINTNVCPQFNCAVRKEDETLWSGFIIFIFACIGFVYNLFRNLLDAHKLQTLYKNKVTKSDVKSTILNTYRRELKWSWIPLIAENCVSISLILVVWTKVYANVKGNRAVYNQSLGFSFIGVIVALVALWVKRRKLSESEEHQKDKVYMYRKTLCCHCCWCSCVAISVLILFCVFLDVLFGEASPVIDIVDPHNESNDVWFVEPRCLFYDDEDIDVWRGDIIGYPGFIYDGCDGSDYSYDLQCAKDEDGDIISLHCELNWNFTSNEVSDCYHVDDICRFDLNVGICNNHTITCDNFDFLEGNPMMWACFDYCHE